jgi:pimeloyl-ACP methyl ester carboxylesterase
MSRMEPTCHRVSGFQGVELAVWEYPGEGPPLLLCHCNGTCAQIWEPVITALRGKYQVYAADARGHGASEKPAPGPSYDWEAMGNDVLAVADHFGWEQGLRAAGHSMGGASLAYAALERPRLCDRFVLLDAVIGPQQVFAGPSPLAAMARRRVAHFPDAAAAMERLGGKPPMGLWTLESLEAYVRHGFDTLDDGSIVLKCPREVEAEIFERGGACGVFDRLAEFAADILVVTGEESELRFLAEAQAAALPRNELRILPDTHHFIPQERPEETAALLAEWLTH